MNFPNTRPSLIARVLMADDTAWTEFVKVYSKPSLCFLSGTLKMPDSEAEDTLQDVFMRIRIKPPDYDPVHGVPFKTLLRTRLRNQFRDWWKHNRRDVRDTTKTVSANTPVDLPPDGAGPQTAPLLDFCVDPKPNLLEVRDEVSAMRKCLHDVLAAILQEKDWRKRHAYWDWFQTCGDYTDEEIARRHGITKHQFRHVREKVTEALKRRLRK